MYTLLKDTRYATRAFAKNPGFFAAAVLSLALGIGATTAIFSVVSALLLHPLPYRNASRLVILWNRSPGLNIVQDWFSPAQYFDIRSSRSFEDVAIAIGGMANLNARGEPERIGMIHVSSNLLPMVGGTALHGRLFKSDEDHPGAGMTAVLNFTTWARRFGSDPNVLGRTVELDGKPYQIVGVLPRSFSLPKEVLPTLGGAEDAEILVPLPLGADAPNNRGREDYNIIAALRPGVSPGQAQAEMDLLTARLRHDFPAIYPPNGGLTFGVVPLLQQVVGEVRKPLLILLGAVGFVLLIACANVANLLLSRGVTRLRELAVRAALGADRSRLIRQMLTESALLALSGGVLGIFLAFAAVRFIRGLGAASVPRLSAISINGEILAFTLILSLVTGLLFGLVPALRISGTELYSSLKESARGSASGALWARGNHLRQSLVVVELALSIILLAGAGLLLRSFARLQEVQPGFDPSGVLTFTLNAAGPRYTTPLEIAQEYQRLFERLDSLPGVSASGAISALPLSEMYAWGPITVEGREPAPGENFINADVRVAGGRYFEAMRIPLLAGRMFRPEDTRENPRVAIVDQAMASELWPGQSALGKRFHLGTQSETSPWIAVVGVVGRIKQYTLDSDSRIAYYLAETQYPAREMHVVVRSAVDPGALTNAIRREAREVDASLPVYSVRTMQERVADSLARRRFAMALLSIFAGLALGLATLGIYGVMSYLVNQGTREIGIRMALGATRGEVLSLILGRGMRVAFAGVGIGLAISVALTRLLRSLLFRVAPSDPFTLTAVSLLLLAVALLACLVPASRASRTDPLGALREE